MKMIWFVPLWMALLVLASCTTPQGAGSWLYVVSPSDLYQVEFPKGPVRHIGKVQDAQGNGITLLDIALNPKDGALYGVNDTLYRVDKNTATLTRIGNGLQAAPGVPSEAVALTFSSDGMLYAGLDGNKLATVDIATGKASIVGSLSPGYSYSGDLAFAPDGRLFATASGQDIYDELLLINPQTGTETPMGNIGYREVFGLQFIGSTLYGLSEGSPSSLIAIDTATGKGTLVRTLDLRGYGIQLER
uniref:DUF6923 domain-containing protein n=1 Tax=Meiothermus ruber TaxID=277 RepID=A0A7C3HZW6_MEIRU